MIINFLRIVKLAFVSGGIHPSRIHLFIIYFLKIFASFFLSIFEKVFLYKKISAIKVESPVFIIGHYRSGTTFLFRLLLADKRFGFLNCTNAVLPYSSILFPKAIPFFHGLINSFNLYNKCFNNKKFLGQDPTEEDLMTVSAGMKISNCWGYLFPKKAERLLTEPVLFDDERAKRDWQKAYLYTVQRIAYLNPGKRLVLKNPPNTGRIKVLLELFPDARFIFIYRNPYHVFLSMEYLWQHVMRSITLQKFSGERQKELIFYFYNILINKYMDERDLIPEDNLLEVCYEDLKNDAFTGMKKIYGEMGLAGFSDIENELREAISRENRYEISPYRFAAGITAEIEAHWKPFIDRWNYANTFYTNNKMNEEYGET